MTYHNIPKQSWNVVNIKGSWYFIDTKMGRDIVVKDRVNIQRLSDFYFLTPPEKFINNHFPYINNDIEDSKTWQLLEHPITIKDFSQRVSISELALKYNIRFPNNPFSTIQVNKTCTLSIISTDKQLKQISSTFLSDDRKNHSHCVIILQENKSEFTVHVRPVRIGRYILKIYGSIHYHTACSKLVEYIVDCESVISDFEPYPKFQQFYGAYFSISEQILDIKPFHTCSNGEYTIDIKTLIPRGVTVVLYDHNDRMQDDCTIIESFDEMTRVKLLLRRKGYYRLEFIGRKTTGPSVLIYNLQPSLNIISYPKTFIKTQVFNCRLIKPITREISIRSDIVIEFSCPKIKGLLVETGGKCEIFHEDSTDLWKIVIYTEEIGTLKISGNTKKYGIFWELYEFIICK